MRWLVALATGALLVLGLLFGITAYRVAKLERVLVEIIGDFKMTTLTTTWTSGGLTHTVSTPRLDGESAVDHAKRHKEAVDALAALFPPDGR